MTNENKNENTQNKPNVVTIIVAIIIAVTLLFYFFTFQVRITEKAVVTTFGKPTKVIDPSTDSGAGLYWKWPYPFQKVNVFDARMRIFTGTLEQIFTSDSKSIILQTYTGWQIDDASKYQIRSVNESRAKSHLESFIRSHTYTVIAKYSFYQIISSSKGKSFLEDIEEKIRQKVNQDVIEFGFEVKEFGFRRLVLPESTTKEVANRMKEERNRLAEEYRSQGAKESKIKRNQADAFRQEKIIVAEARAKEIEGEAFAQIADEYKTFAKDKKLAIWLRKLESLRNILKANRSTLLLDPSTQPFDLLQNSSINSVFSENENINNTPENTNNSEEQNDESTATSENADTKASSTTDTSTEKNVDESTKDESTQEESAQEKPTETSENNNTDEKPVEESANSDKASATQDENQAKKDDTPDPSQEKTKENK
ncbi:protease modulator HflC [Candidatus Uabimicrobium amorphum]|uniref:Protein HflC n=1 Tax=Uabimicrobium amorphum TaxID=2596890 RepID=A0A5S9F1V8_UABAM|nr:protease modulator HflC [Candidatus Uabimicrobium amorphum]BBM82473.1 protein HflC [Candidatus Uabimicrobium amorphum]